MKIHYLSDVHLEFGKWPKTIDVRAIDCDVHVLAGDIGVGFMGLDWALRAFDKPVIYCAGNHEYYGQRSMPEFLEKAKEKCKGTHVHFLDGDLVQLDDVLFLGGTLWTDFALLGENETQTTMGYAAQRMSDYANIFLGHGPGGYGKNKKIKLTPRFILSKHHEHLDFLERNLPFYRHPDRQYRKIVVVTHHSPSSKSLLYGDVHGRIDACYASNLEYLVARSDLWIHGHIHTRVDVTLGDDVRKSGDARIVCNPRGYVGDLVSEFEPTKVIEI